ncbi:hypothetical protein Vretifemale_19732, partial [Volvox reticuliferus]
WDEGSAAAVPSVLRIIKHVEQLMTRPKAACILGRPAKPPGSDSPKEEAVEAQVRAYLGESTITDVAAFGSYTHQLFQLWSNLAASEQLSAVSKAAVRPTGRQVQDVLAEEHTAPVLSRQMRSPFYPCDHENDPVRALYPGSVGCVGTSGSLGRSTPVYNSVTGQYDALYPEECEKILGLETDSTRMNGMAADQRRQLFAHIHDVTYLASMLAMLQVMAGQVKHLESLGNTPHCAAFVSHGVAIALATHTVHEPGSRLYLTALATSSVEEGSTQDIWEDDDTLHLLKHGVPPPGASPLQQKRCVRRAKSYRMQGGVLYHLDSSGKGRVVPRPTERTEVIKKTHEDTGHFGVRRTLGLLLTSYWWRGMAEDVATVVRHCAACDRVNTTFSAQAPTLSSLPVCGLFYRWGVDLCGPFCKTARGHTYVMVCVEHFSKYVVLIPLPDKHAEQTAFAFQQQVLGRYGACAEVCTDQGSEWKGEFAQLLVDALIDHRQTSPNHPQANGLTERAVQTCKNALRRIAEAGGGNTDWDKHLAYVMLGYNCSAQSSSRVAPYHILHAVEPTIPPAIKE